MHNGLLAIKSGVIVPMDRTQPIQNEYHSNTRRKGLKRARIDPLPQCIEAVVVTEHPSLCRANNMAMNLKRIAHSDWDLRQELNVIIEPPIAPLQQEVEYAETGNVNFLSSTRHHGHYFSNLDLFTDRGYNYLKYANYAELRPRENRSTPHLSVSHVSYTRDLRSTADKVLLKQATNINCLRDISFELFGGDVLALMHASELDYRILARVLCSRQPISGKFRGELSINGHQLKPHQLADRIARVPMANPPYNLTVYQYLSISSSFTPPATTTHKTESMINNLIFSLALSTFRNSMLKDLGNTELQRVKIAAALLKDTDILFCDNITKEMEIYDMAFIIDYLRDWAMKKNRIVIMATSPNTLEILHMFSKAAILASGNLVYFGASNKMSDYFQSINFPCPMFKNPCDYYVDLVTFDHLTPKASEESRNRIGHLTELWKSKKPVHRATQIATVSPKVPSIGAINTAWTLFRRMLYETLNSPLQLVTDIVLSTTISILLGLLYFDLSRNKRAGANDRMGLVQCLLYFAVIPHLTAVLSKVHSSRQLVNYEMSQEYYGSMLYGLVKFQYDLPLFFLIGMAYSLPVFSLTAFSSNQYPSIHEYFYFSLVNFCNLFIWINISQAMGNLFSEKVTAFIAILVLFTSSFLCSGLAITSSEQSQTIQLTQLFSPHYWTGHALLEQTFTGTTQIDNLLDVKNSTELLLNCERKKILARMIKEVPIFTISFCSKMKGSQLMSFYGFLRHGDSSESSAFIYFGLIIVGAWMILSSIAVCCTIRCKHKPTGKVKFDV